MKETRTCSRCGANFEAVMHPVTLCGWCECDDRNQKHWSRHKMNHDDRDQPKHLPVALTYLSALLTVVGVITLLWVKGCS